MMRLALFFAPLLLAPPAGAHDADIIYAQVTREEGGVVRECLTLTAVTLLQLAPVDADHNGQIDDRDLEESRAAIEAGVWAQLPLRAGDAPCRMLSSRGQAHDAYVALESSFECPDGELSQVFRVLSVLPSAYKVVLGQAIAQGTRQTLVLPLVLPSVVGTGTAAPSFIGWVGLGVEHIFAGIDHLAFLLALLLVGGEPKRVLRLVTSFTLAHSITLGATALGWVQLGPSMQTWVECAIAASIVWVAIENLVLKEHRHRVWLTFAFGLVHGFGFASVLLDLGLGENAVAALAGFNLGVEAGQAAVVLAAYPLLRIVSRRPVVERWTLRLGSGAVLAVGTFWVVTRLG